MLIQPELLCSGNCVLHLEHNDPFFKGALSSAGRNCTFLSRFLIKISDLAFSHTGLHRSALDTEKYPVFRHVLPNIKIEQSWIKAVHLGPHLVI